MVDKVTTMLLKVDLQCHRCYKKVKKVLCKFPQIQDQVYDEKQNTVTIKVVCCCPEKIKKKIICKGREAIKDIEILQPADHNSGPANPPDQSAGNNEEDRSSAASPPLGGAADGWPVRTCCGECYEGRGGGPCSQPYYEGYCGGRRPVCDEYFVRICPQENNGPNCRIM